MEPQDPDETMATGVRDAAQAEAWLPGTLLDDNVAGALAQANAGFIERLAAGAGSPVTAVHGLPVDLARRVLRLLPLERAQLANCSYALFDLRFADLGHWQQALELPAGAAAAPATGATSRWVRTAVFLAWHLAQRRDLAAALALGMSPPVQALWATVPLVALEAVGVAAEGALQARWPAHPRFWPQLLEAVECGDLRRLVAARHLGWQLLATDGLRPALARRRGARSP